MSIYLDYNASTPIDNRVLDYMYKVYKNNIGNADSRTHDFGMQANRIMEEARSEIAKLANVRSDEIIFTSGATESDNIAIQGLREFGINEKRMHIITTTIEHKAVLGAASALNRYGFEVDYVSPNSDGRISLEDVLNRVRRDTLLVSIMHVNNETGVIQPVREVGKELANMAPFFHVDATQSFGKLVDEIQEMDYDMMSMSAHKMGGPQGVGALIIKRKNYKLPPLKPVLYGGQQERGIRPGTVPTALVAGLGEACRIAAKEHENNYNKCTTIKKTLIESMQQSGIEYSINGDQKNCISNTVNVCFPGVSSEALMLSINSICGISNGSACNSKSYDSSHVLKSMGLSTEMIDSSVRISWGPELDVNNLKQTFDKMIEIAKGLAC